ncbi:MAG: D-alanyl-D-alanine carboxypeptidase family protein [Jatrophihabitans sp.]
MHRQPSLGRSGTLPRHPARPGRRPASPGRRRIPAQLPGRLAALLVTLAIGALGGGVAAAAPLAPRPSSTGISPSAPDPHPPAGGQAPDGSVPGGQALAGRGLVVPAGAPALPKNIDAHGWILADLDTGDILAARDPHGRYQPASILKMLTALTVAPNLPGSLQVAVSPGAAHAEGSAVGLLAGARYSVDQLFDALMLVSGNDAATALAEANGGMARTVAQMNAKAEQLGAYDTVVQTPSGLDGWQQLTSAYDMALVLRAVLGQPRLVGYDRLRSASYLPRASAYGKVGPYQFANQSLNFLDTVPGAVLAKTGYTDAAQHTYLAAARRNGHTLGVILLRDSRLPLDQYQQAAALFGWGFALEARAPAISPVGRLAGPISSDPRPASSLGAAVSLAAAPVPAGLAGSGNWTVLIPVTAAIAGGLWLGCVGIAGRRAIRRRALRLH